MRRLHVAAILVSILVIGTPPDATGQCPTGAGSSIRFTGSPMVVSFPDPIAALNSAFPTPQPAGPPGFTAYFQSIAIDGTQTHNQTSAASDAIELVIF